VVTVVTVRNRCFIAIALLMECPEMGINKLLMIMIDNVKVQSRHHLADGAWDWQFRPTAGCQATLQNKN